MCYNSFMEQEKNTKKIEIDNDKLWSVIAYIIFFIPLIFAKNRSNFLNYHINQGVILFIVSLAGQIGLGIVPNWMGLIPLQIFNALMLACFVIGLMNVFKKEMKPLPVIGKLFTFIK